MGSDLRFLGVFVALPVLAGCYPVTDTNRYAAPIRPVEVVEVHSQSVVEQLTLIGEIEPWREAILYFEETGIVERVFVEEGQSVEQGTPIAILASLDFQLALAAAKAQHESAQQKLNLLLAGSRTEDLEAAKANYERSKVLAVFWAGELKRNQQLAKRGAVSASDLERIRSEHHAAEQDELTTRARWNRAVAGPRKEEIEAARADVEALAREVDLAQRRLDKAQLTAPFRGRVEKRLLDEGSYVNVLQPGGVPVAHLVDLNQVDAKIAIPEAHRNALAAMTSVEVASAFDPDNRAQGKVISLAGVADTDTGTYELRLRIPNSGGQFTGGMVVFADIAREAGRKAIQVPLNAVRHPYGQSPYVMLVGEGDRAVTAEVELGPVRGERVEITSGLSDGQVLIVRGQNQVLAGDQVVRRQMSPPPAPQTGTTP